MPFIEEFEDKINWSWVASNQNVNMKFIEKHIDKLEKWMAELMMHQKLSMRFLSKHIKKIRVARKFSLPLLFFRQTYHLLQYQQQTMHPFLTLMQYRLL